MEHILKIQKRFYTDIQLNGKSFEIRKDDRRFKVGDTILFVNVDGTMFPKKTKIYKINYILRHDDFPDGIPEGYCVFSISEKKR